MICELHCAKKKKIRKGQLLACTQTQAESSAKCFVHHLSLCLFLLIVSPECHALCLFQGSSSMQGRLWVGVGKLEKAPNI